jgi:hypothetical protein
MKIIFQYIIVSFFFLVSVAEAESRPPFEIPKIYSGDPSFDKLSFAVSHTSLFEPAPLAKAQQLILLSKEASSKAFYSQYRILPLTKQGSRTYYKTIETVTPGDRFKGIPLGQKAIVHGQGISFGGIFWPLEKMVVFDFHNKIIYYNKIAITDIQAVKGSLFPMKVGNSLEFKFIRLHERNFNGHFASTIEHGIMRYDIISAHQGTTLFKGLFVPGIVYTLNVSESTNLHPKAYLTDQYDYAPELGWYINDRYYDTNNKLTAEYLLQSWK